MSDSSRTSSLRKPKKAFLSNSGEMTSFTVDDTTIRFKTSKHLLSYESIVEWDHGYIVCMARYDDSDVPEEEYIDLIPILENLYLDSSTFLRDIEEVAIEHAGSIPKGCG